MNKSKSRLKPLITGVHLYLQVLGIIFVKSLVIRVICHDQQGDVFNYERERKKKHSSYNAYLDKDDNCFVKYQRKKHCHEGERLQNLTRNKQEAITYD